MSDSDSNESIQPECSDYESGHPGKSSVDSNCQRQQLGVNVFAKSADLVEIQPPISNFGSTPSTRSAHYKGNRVGHVSPEEVESYKGEDILESPIPTHPKEILRRPFRVTVAGPWVEGVDSRGWERKTLHTYHPLKLQ